VCYENTGHAETVKITYDPARITYQTLLEKFFKFHNPTTLNRQGPDEGEQYRSAIFTADDTQIKAARSFIEKLQASDKYRGRTIVTVVSPAAADGQPAGFWPAEDYHQDYHMKHGGHCALPDDE
jgi:methionine-S-sulfoxide reductase